MTDNAFRDFEEKALDLGLYFPEPLAARMSKKARVEGAVTL